MFFSWVVPRSLTASSSSRLHLAESILGKTDRARLSNPFQARGDIDASTHQVAIDFLDDVAEMNANTEFDAAFRRHAGVAFDHRVLHFDSAANCVDNTAKFYQGPVARPFKDAPVVHRDRRVDQIASESSKPS